MSILTINIAGLDYKYGNYEDFLEFMKNNLKKDKRLYSHINLRNYYYLNRNIKLSNELQQRGILMFEGIGMKTGCLLKKFKLLPDVNGTDLSPMFFKAICENNYNIFLLGSDEISVKKSAEMIKSKYDLNICGYKTGYFNENEESNIARNINELKTDILLLGMGFPRQEQFALRNFDKLNVKMIWCLGGLFDTLSECKKRAPKVFLKMRLEWLYRLMMEPRRMLHRNTIAAFWSLGHIILKG